MPPFSVPPFSGAKLLRDAARALDASVLAPSRIGDRLVDHYYDSLDEDLVGEGGQAEPWWLGSARMLQKAQVRLIAGKMISGWQRAAHGWSEADTHDLGFTMSRRMGEMLVHLSQTAHGWPSTEEFPTYESWVEALEFHGRILRDRSDVSAAQSEALEQWYTLASSSEADPEAVAVAAQHAEALEKADREAVRASLHWVAEHYDRLWD